MIIIDFLLAVTALTAALTAGCALLEKIPQNYADRLLRLLQLK